MYIVEIICIHLEFNIMLIFHGNNLLIREIFCDARAEPSAEVAHFHLSWDRTSIQQAFAILLQAMTV